MRSWLSAAAAAVFIALCLALAACGSSGHPAAGSSGQTQDASGRSQLEAVVQCLRAHGVPDFPDPVYDPSDGRWHYADYRPDIPQSAQQACQHLDPSAVRASPPVPQAQFQALVRLAQCIRQHGVPTWPDPNPQGQFRLPSSLLTKSDPAENNAVEACQRYIPIGGIDEVNASTP
jgi:hypothetical protein